MKKKIIYSRPNLHTLTPAVRLSCDDGSSATTTPNYDICNPGSQLLAGECSTGADYDYDVDAGFASICDAHGTAASECYSNGMSAGLGTPSGCNETGTADFW